MWLRDTMRKANAEEVHKLDLDSFGKIMDEFIQKSKVGLAVTKEEGDAKWTVHGAGCGAVMDFYIFLNALEPIFLNMLDEMQRAGGIDAEKLAGALCEVMEQSLIEAAKERSSGTKTGGGADGE